MAADTETKMQVRGPKDEEADFDNTVQGLLDRDYEDWPNEAGFEGLDEIRGPVELLVKGSIPAWAAGTLYRTGPGEFIIEDTPKGTFRTTHWFDGFGHTHKFNIIASSDSGGESSESDKSIVRVEYTSRRQTQALVDAVRKTGQRPDVAFGQRVDPCIGLFGKVMSIWRGAPSGPEWDNVCVTIQANVPGLPSLAKGSQSGHRGDIKNLWLTTDNGIVKAFDQNTLEPVGVAKQKKLHPLLTGPLSCAHAQRDPKTGDYFNYNLDFGRFATYRIFRTNMSTGTTDILATISSDDVKAAYIHSFFLSPSFVIFCVPSSHLGWRGIKVPWERNMVDGMEPFDESKLCKWFIIDRLGNRGVVATFESPAGFYFHSVNSFEEHDEATGAIDVYCDVIEYPTLDVVRAFELDVILHTKGKSMNFWGDRERNRNSQARLNRWKFRVSKPDTSDADGDVNAGVLTVRPAEKVFEIKAPHAGELPTINPANATKKYRYVYSLANRGYSTLLDSIVKTDLTTREALFWDNPRGHTPGEAIFVPRPRPQGEPELDEDDGVLLSVVLDGFGKTSYLVCLDAKTMKELGRAECDFAISFGFHGLHWPPSKTPQL
ncbi:carotenoid oxygenase [Hypoxylon crocopeplum]|nr:carotenoid oxygenase [Hypoxylon crocopeplum]